MDKAKRNRGTILAMLAAGAVTVMGAAALAIDVGYLYVFKGQLQNAVDAAALAGAQGLLAQPGDHSPNGQAMRLAMEYAAKNIVGNEPLSLSTDEITFPERSVIKVEATRPAPTFFGVVFGLRQVRVRAVAVARAAPATGGSYGWRPFMPPDQFAHGSTCVTPFDEDHGPFDPQPHVWNGIRDRDYYRSPYDASFENVDLSGYTDCSYGSPTGFIAPRDVNGRPVELKSDNPRFPGNFYAVAFDGRGANDYRDHIANGWNGTLSVGDYVTTEPGNMVGPTRQGIQELIAKDPSARLVRGATGWYVRSDLYPINESPRIVPIPLFDPTSPPGGGRTTLRVSNIGAFFITGTDGRSVFGYFITRRLPAARSGRAPENSSTQSTGGAGRLLGTVQLDDPSRY
ncbi:MAG TPA: Tad domain-containing protein [Blastocatellia bacterium]|nr:Tad domain-containing protein [Blastocatellia bacterium]